MINTLLWVGLAARNSDGSIRWPFHVAPLWMWKAAWKNPRGWYRLAGGFIGIFRNLPGVIKWRKGRLLPRRWGITIMGLIEIGDRG